MAWLAWVQLNSVFLFSPSQAMSESRIFERIQHFSRYLLRLFPSKISWVVHTYDYYYTQKNQPQLPEYFASENLFECGKTPPYVLDPITIEVLEIWVQVFEFT